MNMPWKMVINFNYFNSCSYALNYIKYAKMSRILISFSLLYVPFFSFGGAVCQKLQGALTFSSDEDNLFALRLGRPVELRWDGKI